MATNFHGALSLRAAGLVGVAAALIFTGCGSTRPTGKATEKTMAKAAEKAGENAARTFAEKPAEKAAEKTAKKNVEQVTDEAAVDGWPNFRGPDHNGISKESILPWPKTGPKQLWKKSVGKGYSSIAVAEGRIYTMGNTQGTDTVWCLDAKSGREVWKFSYACSQRRSYPGPRSTPTVDSGFVYTLSHEGHLFCLRSDSGKEVWSKHLQDDLGLRPPNRGYAGSALIQGNLLVLNAGSAGLVLEKSSGRVVWKSGTDQCGYATPVPFVLKGRKCVAIFGAGALMGVDLASGQELWRYPWRTSWGVNATDPIVSGNEFFISSAYNQGCALIRVHEGKARKLWQNKEMMNHFSACVLYQGHLYGIDGDIRRGDSQLKCIDFKTGQTKWKTRAVRGGSVLMARDKLVALTGRGELVLAKVSPAGYQELARSQILSGDCWTVPVLAGGRLHARNLRGDMVCVQTTRQPQQPSAKALRDGP